MGFLLRLRIPPGEPAASPGSGKWEPAFRDLILERGEVCGRPQAQQRAGVPLPQNRRRARHKGCSSWENPAVSPHFH